MVAYRYATKVAFVKGSPNTLAASASVLVYALTDTGYTTPLVAYEDRELTIITNIITDPNGIPETDFYLDGHPDCRWKSGTMVGEWATTQSRPGLQGPVSTVPGPQGDPGPSGTNGLNGANGATAKWTVGLPFAVGDPVINPDGDLVTVTTAHTSGGSYDAGMFSTPYDTAVAALTDDTGTATRVLMDGTFGQAVSTPSWKPSTVYAADARVVSPSGALVKATVGFTSGLTYNAADWTTVAPAALMPRYYDDGGNYTDRGALQVLARQVPAPNSLQHNIYSIVSGLGDNTTFRGVSGGMFQARDLGTVATGTKGVLYGSQHVVAPAIDRNNVPFDDVVGISIENQGTAKGTDALYFGHTRGDRVANPTGLDWGNVIQSDAVSDNFIRSIGTHSVGISLSGATITTTAIRLGNAQTISSNKADGTIKHLIRLSSGNTLQLAQSAGGIDIRDAFAGIYAQAKVVMPNNTAIFGIRFGVTNEYEMVRISASDNLALFAGRATVLAGGGLLLQDVTTVPSAPTGGHVIYSEAGELKCKGPSGTITSLGVA